MFQRWVGVILICMSLPGCLHFKHNTPPDSPHPTITPFNQIRIKGDVNVVLHTGVQRPSIHIQGDPRDLTKLTWRVSHKILHIDLGRGYPKQGPINIDLAMLDLISFKYRGQGRIIGRNISSRWLDLSINNQGKTYLEGSFHLHRVFLGGSGSVQLKGGKSHPLILKLKDHVRAQIIGTSNIRSLMMSDHSFLSAYWIKSRTLQLRLKDQAKAQLAGILGFLSADLKDESYFNGRYLRTTRAYVKTHDHSRADIAVIKAQHTLATDDSNIYYYAIPRYQTDFMAETGSVLDLRIWDQF